MESTRSYRFFNRGPSTVARLAFFGILSMLVLFIDARYKTFETVRGAIQFVVYPFQRLTTLPGLAWDGVNTYFTSNQQLQLDNNQLQLRQHTNAVQLQQLQVLQLENQQLRNLLNLRQQVNYPMQASEIAYVEQDFFKRKIILDKGLTSNVQSGQIVMDDIGIVGQITHVYPLASEVTLITHKDHAVPVQVLRSGLRAVVFGAGNISELTLRYMPMNADIVVGDELVTSGIDGTYPAGIRVAKVTKVERDPAYPFARIVAVPVAGIDKNRQLLIATSAPPLAERPPEAAEKSGKKAHSRSGR
jgi:rod shape-determining protein MreC